MAQKVIRTEYSDGKVVLSNIRNNKGFPVFRENDTVTATKVTQWYDGSVMSPDKADGKVYLRYKSTGEYFLVNLPNFGELFLEKDTMQSMRDMSSTEILLLKMGYYKGVRLNGYYSKNDTPKPIEYFLSTTSQADDGGSVIVIGDIKLEHEFTGDVDMKYFGISGDDSDISMPLQKALDNPNMANTNFLFYKGSNRIKNISLRSNINLVGVDSKVTVDGGHGFVADSIENVKVKGFDIKGENQPSGYRFFNLLSSKNINVSENIMSNGENGIHATQCEELRIVDNNITGMQIWGIYVDGVNSGLVHHNFCSGSITADGIKVGGVTDVGDIKRSIKRLIISSNICYGNFRDGIDCASNEFENVILTDNILEGNQVQGIEFKILSGHTGFSKNIVIQNNLCQGNLGSGLSLGVESPDSTTEVVVKGNTLKGTGLSATANYAMSVQIRGNAGTRAIICGNIIRDYYYGIRLNNSSFVEIFKNDIYTRRFGIYLRNGLSTDLISDVQIYQNTVKSFDHSAISVGLITDTNLIGNISNVTVKDNKVSMVSYVQKPIFIQPTTGVLSILNEVATYLGAATLPSFPSNAGDLVVVNNPVVRGFSHWIAIASNEGASVNNYIPYNVFGNASSTLKGLVNQTSAQANIPQTALEAISTADGSDAATTQALANAIKAYINANVVPLVNAIRSSQNTELENQRTAGQQAS